MATIIKLAQITRVYKVGEEMVQVVEGNIYFQYSEDFP